MEDHEMRAMQPGALPVEARRANEIKRIDGPEHGGIDQAPELTHGRGKDFIGLAMPQGPVPCGMRDTPQHKTPRDHHRRGRATHEAEDRGEGEPTNGRALRHYGAAFPHSGHAAPGGRPDRS